MKAMKLLRKSKARVEAEGTVEIRYETYSAVADEFSSELASIIQEAGKEKACINTSRSSKSASLCFDSRVVAHKYALLIRRIRTYKCVSPVIRLIDTPYARQ